MRENETDKEIKKTALILTAMPYVDTPRFMCQDCGALANIRDGRLYLPVLAA